MLMLNKFILKSAPLDLRLPVSSLFVVCLIVPYRNPATPNETLVLMLFMINTQNPGFNPNLISDVVVLVFFNEKFHSENIDAEYVNFEIPSIK